MAAVKKKNPEYRKFLNNDDVQYIMRLIGRGYHERNDYPPFAISPFEDRPRYHQYVERVLKDLIE